MTEERADEGLASDPMQRTGDQVVERHPYRVKYVGDHAKRVAGALRV